MEWLKLMTGSSHRLGKRLGFPARKEKILVYKAKLMQLSSTLPSRFARAIESIYRNLDELVYQVPWFLTHSDLSNMNLLVDPDSCHLTGIVDCADASIERIRYCSLGIGKRTRMQRPTWMVLLWE